MRVPLVVRFASVALASFVAGFVAFPSLPNSAPLWLTGREPVSVDRTLKGDRLPLIAPISKSHELGLPVAPGQSQPRAKIPVGCEAAFSPISAPQLANIFRRCTV
jgi:hypothetical protein